MVTAGEVAGGGVMTSGWVGERGGGGDNCGLAETFALNPCIVTPRGGFLVPRLAARPFSTPNPDLKREKPPPLRLQSTRVPFLLLHCRGREGVAFELP